MEEYYQNLIEKCKKEIIVPELTEEFEEYINKKYDDDVKEFSKFYDENETKQKANSNIERLMRTMLHTVSRERAGFNKDRRAKDLDGRIKVDFDGNSATIINPLVQFTLEGEDIANNYYERTIGTVGADRKRNEIHEMVMERVRKIAAVKRAHKADDKTIEELMKKCKEEIIIPEFFDKFEEYMKKEYEGDVEDNKLHASESKAKKSAKETVEEILRIMLNTISRKREVNVYEDVDKKVIANYLYQEIEQHMWTDSYGSLWHMNQVVCPLLYYTEDGPEILKDYYELLEQKGQCKSAKKVKESIDDVIRKKNEKIANIRAKKNSTADQHSTSGKNTSGGISPDDTDDGVDIEL